ncbi:hypothetical protein DCS_04223 [Drechmeria coniospora]|uniref:Uncharacterized protein n=1 Tax=Drechmeria coniospora TaxID=98403 RepID=A0A151GJF2_DRECN|nr:hypothetical protein DCS_04223 [Drechmeria coniospora]KYK57216.1 hypothetical protein DCS_04223 [Drechmeria coniospora]
MYGAIQNTLLHVQHAYGTPRAPGGQNQPWAQGLLRRLAASDHGESQRSRRHATPVQAASPSRNRATRSGRRRPTTGRKRRGMAKQILLVMLPRRRRRGRAPQMDGWWQAHVLGTPLRMDGRPAWVDGTRVRAVGTCTSPPLPAWPYCCAAPTCADGGTAPLRRPSSSPWQDGRWCRGSRTATGAKHIDRLLQERNMAGPAVAGRVEEGLDGRKRTCMRAQVLAVGHDAAARLVLVKPPGTWVYGDGTWWCRVLAMIHGASCERGSHRVRAAWKAQEANAPKETMAVVTLGQRRRMRVHTNPPHVQVLAVQVLTPTPTVLYTYTYGTPTPTPTPTPAPSPSTPTRIATRHAGRAASAARRLLPRLLRPGSRRRVGHSTAPHRGRAHPAAPFPSSAPRRRPPRRATRDSPPSHGHAPASRRPRDANP